MSWISPFFTFADPWDELFRISEKVNRLSSEAERPPSGKRRRLTLAESSKGRTEASDHQDGHEDEHHEEEGHGQLAEWNVTPTLSFWRPLIDIKVMLNHFRL